MEPMRVFHAGVAAVHLTASDQAKGAAGLSGALPLIRVHSASYCARQCFHSVTRTLNDKLLMLLQNKYKIRVASSPEEAEAMRLQAQQQQQQQQQAGGQQGVLVAQS
jgi:hypothetical protein